MSNEQFNRQHGSLIDGHTLRLERRLPGPIERVWSYLTEPELRRQWLAGGTTALQPGAAFEMVWRNDELSASADERPEGFEAESRATCQLVESDPPRRMRYRWPGVGDVSVELEAAGSDMLLTLTHRELVGETLVSNVCAGWHAHLALLIARLEGQRPPSFWRTWKRLRDEYEGQLCAN